MESSNSLNSYKSINMEIEKNKNNIDACAYRDIKNRVNNEIQRIEISDEFGISLTDVHVSGGYIELGRGQTIMMMGKDFKRTIGCSDNGKQPENERLYVISYPTGAYIFGNSYPKELFIEYFLELENLKPKYSDTVNHSLYFTGENSANAFYHQPLIFNKYKEKLKSYLDTKEIEKLKLRLKELEQD